jgi:hypothetical protein
MDHNDEIVNLLRDIQRTQLKEARLAKVRWKTAIVLFICCWAIAAPAVLWYIHRLLILWF